MEIQTCIPVVREQTLRKEESQILTNACLHENKSRPAVAAQLTAHNHAEDLFAIHENYELHFRDKGNHTRADEHSRYKQQAHQLKLLALETLTVLIQS